MYPSFDKKFIKRYIGNRIEQNGGGLNNPINLPLYYLFDTDEFVSSYTGKTIFFMFMSYGDFLKHNRRYICPHGSWKKLILRDGSKYISFVKEESIDKSIIPGADCFYLFIHQKHNLKNLKYYPDTWATFEEGREKEKYPMKKDILNVITCENCIGHWGCLDCSGCEHCFDCMGCTNCRHLMGWRDIHDYDALPLIEFLEKHEEDEGFGDLILNHTKKIFFTDLDVFSGDSGGKRKLKILLFDKETLKNISLRYDIADLVPRELLAINKKKSARNI